MSSVPLGELQRRLLEHDEIVRIRIDVVMPRGGGYNARPYDAELRMQEPLRATEVKAIWRWWLRAAYSACTCGTKDYKDLDEEVSKILGSTGESSKFRVVLIQTREADLLNTSVLESVPRLRLLTLGRRRDEIQEILRVHERVQAEVVVYKDRRDVDVRELRSAIAALMVSLILGGLGSVTGRGLGSIIVRDMQVNLRYEAELRDVRSKVMNILNSDSSDKLKSGVVELVKYLVDTVCKERECADTEGLPIVPALIPERYFKVEVIDCSNVRPLNAVRIIGEACLKVTWKRLLRMNARDPDGRLHTWILGLPRSVRKRGYFIKLDGDKLDPSRRASAIRLKYFENNRGKFILVYGFISGDWPLGKLYHLNPFKAAPVTSMEVWAPGATIGRQPCRSKNVCLQEAFDAALKFIVWYLSGECRRLGGAGKR